MPWHEPQSAPFTRIGIVSQVPSQSGVFGLMSADACLLVAESWNLKARLLDLINTLDDSVELTVVYELCPEADAEKRRDELQRELMSVAPAPVETATSPLPGISFRVQETAHDALRDGPEL